MRYLVASFLSLLLASASLGQPSNGIRTLPAKEKRWALIIGVDRYDDPDLTLGGAARDARTLRDALVSSAAFPADQVVLLASGETAERLPTRANILRRLSTLLTKSVPRDGLFLLAFSGHGVDKFGNVYLYPSDVQNSDNVRLLQDTSISVASIHEQIEESEVSQVLLLIDSCRTDPGGKAGDANKLTASYLKPFSFETRNRGVQAFATLFATAIGTRAYEYAEKHQGYFTWAVVEGLKGAAANERGEVTLGSLSAYVQDVVPKLVAEAGLQQVPFTKIEGYRADELVLAVIAVPEKQPTTTPPVMQMAVGPDAIEYKFWDSAEKLNTPEAYREYLRKYPNGEYAALARMHLGSTQPAPAPPTRNDAPVDYTDLAKARETLRKRVATGDAQASLALGQLLYTCLGGSCDFSEGAWLLQAAMQGGAREAEGWLGYFLLTRGEDNVTALRHAKESAARGEMAGQLTLADAYEYGIGVEPNADEAERLRKLALPALRLKAAQGDAWAENFIGTMYESGSGGIPKDDAKAVELYRSAAAKGLPIAQVNLADYYISGAGGVAKDAAKAVELYRQAADRGHPHAMRALAAAYRYGNLGLPKDEAKAVELYQMAVDRHSNDAQNELGVMNELGQGGLQKDYKKAAELYAKAADNGNAYGLANLARFYEDGVAGLPKDLAKAADLYRKAAARDLAFAKAQLGTFYETGKGGVQQDVAKAVELYRQAAEAGDAIGQRRLGEMYQWGSGVPKDLVKAVEWYRKAADQNEAEAQADLAYMYNNGLGGLTADPTKAAQLYRKAADAGNSNGENGLGYMYDNGQGGLTKDQAKALELYRKAADHGSISALNNIAADYEDGIGGVTKDLAKAVEYYQKAADRGSSMAQYNLGRMYEEGLGGLTKDQTKALEYYRKAAAAGNTGAQNKLAKLKP